MTDPKPAAEDADARRYADVVAHFHACDRRNSNLNEIWSNTLNRVGADYSIEEFRSALSTGSRVGAGLWINTYLCDATLVDLSDPIVARLTRNEQSTVGFPARNVVLPSGAFNSTFLAHLNIARTVIREIQKSGIEHPRILEIGGGMGNVQRILRGYFGSSATFYAVDIPEILQIQEWLNRSEFPDAPTSFKATERPVDFVAGGFNFINAYVVETQGFAFDVAINVDSMQEMNADVANAYIKFIERNISPGGFFYFENHYGHGTDSVDEPTDYVLDEFWTIDRAGLRDSFQLSSTDISFAVLFKRTKTGENPASRRMLLRALWNGFLAGFLPVDRGFIRSFASLARSAPPSDIAAAIERALAGSELPPGLSRHLTDKNGKHFPAAAYVSAKTPPHESVAETGGTFAQAMAGAERAYIRALQHAATATGTAAPADLLRPVAIEMERRLQSGLRSEYWSARVASFLLPLGFRDAARGILVDTGKRSAQIFWLVRFAHLLASYDFIDEAGGILDAIASSKRNTLLDGFARAKLAELNARAGRAEAAESQLDALLAASSISRVLALTLAMTAVRMDDTDRLARALDKLSAIAGKRSVEIFTSLSAAASGSPAMRALAAERAEALKEPASGHAAIVQAGLWLRLGALDRADAQFEDVRRSLPDDYYVLAGAGRRFMRAGAVALATDCLERSKMLRPGNHMHLDFVGGVFFEGQLWDKARAAYEEAVALKPYLRSYLARHAYSAVPEPLKSSGALGAPSELAMIVQTSQDFYHDIGFREK